MPWEYGMEVIGHRDPISYGKFVFHRFSYSISFGAFVFCYGFQSLFCLNFFVRTIKLTSTLETKLYNALLAKNWKAIISFSMMILLVKKRRFLKRQLYVIICLFLIVVLLVLIFFERSYDIDLVQLLIQLLLCKRDQ